MYLNVPGVMPVASFAAFPAQAGFLPPAGPMPMPGGAPLAGFDQRRFQMLQMLQIMMGMLQLMGSLLGGQGDLGSALGMPGLGGMQGLPGTAPALPVPGASPAAGGPSSFAPQGAGNPGAAPSGPAGLAPGAAGQADPAFASRLPAGLRPLAGAFEQAGRQYGIDPKFLAAISMMETGNGTSSAFRNKNNAMGVSGRGGPRSFSHPSESIQQMARTLANPRGYYKNARTIREIGRIYAPVGAANDPKGTNGHWVNGVSKFYAQLGGNPNDAVLRR